MPEPRHLTEGDFLRLFVKHEEALRAFTRVLLPTWEAVDDVTLTVSTRATRQIVATTNAPYD